MLNHGQLYTGKVVFIAREDKQTGTHFLQPCDQTVGHLIKNGSVKSEDFLEVFNLVSDIREIDNDKEFAYLQNIEKPFGPMPFYKALAACIQGQKISRFGWNGKGMFITYYKVQENDPITEDILVINHSNGRINPWVPSQSDQLANDWMIV